MKKHRRLLAGLVCAALVVLLFVSSAYIVCEAHHECVGDACEICEQILQAKALIQRFALLGMILPALIATLLVKQAVRALRELPGVSGRTLVSWKVRLNN